MKICFLSDYDGIADEGMRNVAFYLSRELGRQNEVLHLCLKPYPHLLLPRFWKRLRDFHPHIIHFIPGPSLKSFTLVKLLKALCPEARTVMSALHPLLNAFSQRLVPWLKPDLLLTQAPDSEARFHRLGFRLRFLPNGVDTERFQPATPQAKMELRQKYGLSQDNRIVLHVGPLLRQRNILPLGKLASRSDTQVLIVGQVSGPYHRDILKKLRRSGCLVWRRYLENVPDIYALADCYVFPTIEKSAVELPLSVLEAMACNLPVITTPFGALPRVFTPGDGLEFVTGEEEMFSALEQVKQRTEKVKTREKVLPYSWRRIAGELETIYQELLRG